MVLRWLRGQGSNLELLLQGQAWFRFHHLAFIWLAFIWLALVWVSLVWLALVWTERFELPTSGLRRRRASVAPRPVIARCAWY